MRPIELSEEVNGKNYFTIRNFARATNRSAENIRFLLSYGNKIRKLRKKIICGRPMVPYEELMEFPFTLPSRSNAEPYHYNEQGEIVEVQD